MGVVHSTCNLTDMCFKYDLLEIIQAIFLFIHETDLSARILPVCIYLTLIHLLHHFLIHHWLQNLSSIHRTSFLHLFILLFERDGVVFAVVPLTVLFRKAIGLILYWQLPATVLCAAMNWDWRRLLPLVR